MPSKLSAMRWNRAVVLTLSIAAFVFLAVGPFHLPYGPYNGRNGVIEALDDVAAHRPIKLYAYYAAQIDYSSRIPGIDCPDTQLAGLRDFTREIISEAFVSESYTPTWIAMRRGEAARSFAYLYNTTMLRAHGSELLRACPGIKAIPYYPGIDYR